MSTEKLLEAATVLQEVDVSQIMSSMALSIADAQQRLDDNSVNQLITLADATNGINGKSLLELGFSPTFYHFQHADISASISLKMKVAESTELGVSASLEYSSNVEKNDQIKSFFDQKDELAETGEYKGHRKFIKYVNATSTTTIGKKSVKIDQSKEIYTKINDLTQQIRESEQVDRLKLKTKGKKIDLSIKASDNNAFEKITEDGFSTIYIPNTVIGGEGILKITNYVDKTNVTYDNNKDTDFEVTSNFSDTFNAAVNSARTKTRDVKITGFTNDTDLRKGIKVYTQGGPILEVKHYFDYDLNTVLFNYVSGSYSNRGTLQYFELLSKILKEDSTAYIEIIGTTDKSGGNATNLNLSNRRAEAMKTWFERTGVPSGQIAISGKGETWASGPNGVRNQEFRYVIVRFHSKNGSKISDYIHFLGKDFVNDKCSPTKTSSEPNLFIYHTGNGNGKTGKLTLVIGKQEQTFESAGSAKDMALNISGNAKINSSKIATEYENALLYMLHEESHLEFDVYSKDESNIEIDTSNTTNISEDTKDTYIKKVDKNKVLSNLKESSKNRNSQRYFAIGGTFDYRTAKKHEIDVEGNASMSVRLVSLPAPAELLNEVKKALSKDS
ncbi:OmpA family protein [Aquimarina sp. 2201CG1-2-11]|uniref:OmpA family protein n=1 Tax=Aquimarina discodermiae TaxID=3231043 RepID=UPI0034620A30